MTGEPAEILTLGNCGNPRFDPGYVLPSEPTAPAATGDAGTAGGGARGSGGAGAAGAGTTGTAADLPAVPPAGEATEAGIRAVGGGSRDWRDADPVGYDRPGMSPLEMGAWIVVLAALAVPLVGGMVWAAIRRPRF
jgi:hypothetical protein